MTWILAIDFGTTATAAAVFDGDPELIEVDGLARLPSLVLLGADGVPIVGAAAERQAPGQPERVERTPKRRLGDRMLLLGDQAVDPVDLVAAVLRRVAEEARRRQGGTDPSEVVLTHPVAWVGARLAALREAARRAGLGDVTLLPEPVAAAVHLSDDRIRPGDHVAVYDLGGGTFDAAILRRTANGFESVGAPGGDEHLGGEHFDEMLYDWVGTAVAARDPEGWANLQSSEDRLWVRANGTLRNEVRAAKEALSTTPEYTIYVPQVDVEVRVTREDLEDLIRPSIERTVDELVATVERAGLTTSNLAAVYMVGGSSRIPLAARFVSERTGLVPLTWGDPKAAVALGAARRTGAANDAPVVLGAADAATALFDTAAAAGADGAIPPPAGVPVEPVPPVERSERFAGRTPLIAAAAIAAVVALILAVVFIGGRGDGDERLAAADSDRTTTSTTIAEGTITRSFLETEAGGVRTGRQWTFTSADGTLANELTLTNTDAAAPKQVSYFEVIPKEVAATVDALTFDPQPAEVVKADPVVRYDVTLEPGAAATLRWTVVLDGDVDAARLGDLAAARDAAEQAFHQESAALIAESAGDGAVVPPAPPTTAATQPTTKTSPTPGVSTTAPSTGGGGGTTTPTTTGGSTQTTSTPTTSGSTNTTSPPTTASISTPGQVASLVARDPVGEEYNEGVPQKVRVTLQWSPPSDNGGQAPTGYKIRCTLMYNADANDAVKAAAGPCKGGADYGTVSGGTTSTQVVVDRIDPGPGTWMRWEVAAINSAGTGPLRTAQVVVPNVTGLKQWEAYPVVRGVGLAAGGSTTDCGQESGTICSQNRTAGTTVSAGLVLVMAEQS